MSLSRHPWLGSTPEKWPIGRFKHAGQFMTGCDHKSLPAGDVPVYGSSQTPFAFVSRSLAVGPAIAIGRKGTVDQPYFIQGPFWAVDTCMFNKIRNPAFSIRYCYYVACAVPWLDYSTKTALPSLTQATVDNIPLPRPPLEAQHNIVEQLDRVTSRIDALVAKKTHFIELLREKRQALITQAVTKGLDPSVPMKDSGVEWLGEVPAHWDIVRGGSVLVEQRAKNDPLRSDYYLSLMANIGIIPYAEKGDVGNKKPDDLTKCKMVSPGDFVINSMNYAIGSYGVSAYAGVCSPVYVVMRHRPEVMDPKFMDLILSNPSYQNYAQSFGTGILDHRRAIGWDEIKMIRVPLPPLDEQEKIASWTITQRDRVDLLIAKTERSIELLREHRTALITAAVTGKIDLRDFA